MAIRWRLDRQTDQEEFIELWNEVNRYMRTQPGYLSHRLHRSIQPDARFRFVNVAQWESAQALQAAHGDGFRKLVTQLAWAEFRSIPAHYEVVSENRSERESRASARA